MKLLMITFHFPPVSGSSGYLRALKMAKYLPQFGVLPSIFSINESAYENVDRENLILLEQLSPEVTVYRGYGFDARKMFGWKNKYPGWLAIPDRWVSWVFFSLPKVLVLHYRHKFDAIWVTFPIASALMLGWLGSKLSGLPLYVDVRDPIWEEETWRGTIKQKVLVWLEKKVLYRAKNVYFTSPGTIEKYHLRHPALNPAKFELVPNGFDEDDFKGLKRQPQPDAPKLFLHSGLLPPYERDPSCFFQAVADLKNQGKLSSNEVIFRFRASGHDNLYHDQVVSLGIAEIIEFSPRLPYREALQEMFNAHSLMLFQQTTCNWQTPAKLYEYMRTSVPIISICGKNSDANIALEELNYAAYFCEINNLSEIKSAILEAKNNTVKPFKEHKYSTISRQNSAKKVAESISQKIK